MVKLILLLIPFNLFAQTFNVVPKVIFSFPHKGEKITLDEHATVTVADKEIKFNDKASYPFVKDGSKLHTKKSSPGFSIEIFSFSKEETINKGSSTKNCTYSGWCFRCGFPTKMYSFFPKSACKHDFYKDCKGTQTVSNLETYSLKMSQGKLYSEGQLIADLVSNDTEAKLLRSFNNISKCK